MQRLGFLLKVRYDILDPASEECDVAAGDGDARRIVEGQHEVSPVAALSSAMLPTQTWGELAPRLPRLAGRGSLQ
jgi:hypothetical protein